jgi:hypothetical protein
VQPDLGQERWEPGYRVSVDVVVGLEQVPLRRRALGRAAQMPGVERALGLNITGKPPRVLPPCLQVAPQDALVGGAVEHQDLVGAGDDLDVVADGVDDPDVRPGRRGEDEVLRQTAGSAGRVTVNTG